MIDNDDLLHRVDQHYLGPTGLTLPFRIRYAALGLGAALMVIVFVIARGIVHIPLGFKSLVVVIGIVVVLTAKVTKVVNADRPVRSVVRAAWNDLNAPRPPKAGQTVTLRLPTISSASGRKHAATPIEGESSR
ncbi:MULTISPECIES: hypothetical protein [unclassified Rhodococcus (in: high G+C Gram-positive bacteria)]|uniref:hypothetical protein n=1 Tax=unclassified Rhodococcus (in: high G+C Gram-positive bacteria) TaxID=192944 RepID=UPI0009756F29|nr:MULTISPECIES: hypothetical protein [unclassified Rhodococcus (in: high G+C Gram-positive bacteria)]MCC4306868.1 hypothetical protein [Rhodococcus sp. 3-2]MDF3319888.1 hypothetical protein [Rhodococcus sp. C3V]OMQ24842.1 hypothetical protein BK799_31210 [Rhodococcus sp. D-1]